MSITRRNYGRGHSYAIDGTKAEGVTTLLGRALPKSALIDWAGRTTASYAVDHWAELAELKPSVRLDRLNRSRYEERDAAARRGTEVHRFGARGVAGEDLADCPEELRGHVESYVDFLNTWDPQPVLVEAVVAHRALFYAGTLDLVADLADGHRWLLDLKTGRSGIYGETALQCAAYARAEVYVDAEGDEHDMAELGIERTGAVHVRADGWDLYPLRYDDDMFLIWRHVLWTLRHAGEEQQREWVGESLSAPAASEVAS